MEKRSMMKDPRRGGQPNRSEALQRFFNRSWTYPEAEIYFRECKRIKPDNVVLLELLEVKFAKQEAK